MTIMEQRICPNVSPPSLHLFGWLVICQVGWGRIFLLRISKLTQIAQRYLGAGEVEEGVRLKVLWVEGRPGKTKYKHYLNRKVKGQTINSRETELIAGSHKPMEQCRYRSRI